MLTLQEKNKIKDVLSQGLNINRNINFPYFLNAIDDTNKEVQSLRQQLNMINQKQNEIEYKLDRIINLLSKKL